MILALVLAAATVLPVDRLAMADRLFNKGKYAEAAVEYKALAGAEGVAADELEFRLAECDRVLNDGASARARYRRVFTAWPDSPHVARARFMYAMGSPVEERRRVLAELDSDRTPLEDRVAALYHLGSETSDRELLAKCVRLAPEGRYAPYANLKYATLLSASEDPAERRKGIEVLIGIAFGKSPLAPDALYLAAVQCYREKKYDEAGSLFRRYRRSHPKGENAADARAMGAWCEFMSGRYSDAAALCGDGETDDLAYIRAACAYSTGDNTRALALFKKYLEDYPNGQYRADAELPIARIEFDAAQRTADKERTIESARRSFGLSKLASDQLRLAWAYEKAGKIDEARQEYVRLAGRFPGTEEAAEAMYRKAMADAREGNWSAAELALAEALSGDKLGVRRAEALYWRGVAAMKIAHEQEGAAFLEQAVAAGLGLDEAREARLMLADFDWKSGRVEKAKAAYETLVNAGACDRMSSSRILAVGRLLDGAACETCATALTRSESAEWRQAGWGLLGRAKESAKAYSAARDAYRKCLAEKATTESAAPASLALGRLEFRAGELDAAEATLKKSIALNSNDARARAEAYLTLAKVACAKSDWPTARSYATVVLSLFDEAVFAAEAQKILSDHPEPKEP